MKRNNIIHIIGNLGNGGKERRMIQCVKGLAATNRYNQRIVLLNDTIVYKEVFEIESVSISVLKQGNLISLYNQISAIIRETQADIIHSWIDTKPFLLLLPIIKIRFHLKYIAGYIGDGIKIGMLNSYNILSQFTYLVSDRIISNSYAGLVAKRALYKKSQVIYNGFDYARIKTINDKDSFKAEFCGIGEKIVVMIGRMRPAKDFSSFIAVAEEAAKANMKVHFLAIGDGPLLEDFKNEAKRKHLDNITFTGQRSDIESILQIADVSMLFSNDDVHAEGVSNSIMESMAAGVPVIATIGGGTPEIIDDGVNGFIVPPKDYKLAFSRLKQLLEDKELYDDISKHSVKTIEQKFLLSRMTEDYVKLYSELL